MESKFVQLIANDHGLMALDSEGDVWVYLGRSYGWAKLEMERLTAREAKIAHKEKQFSSGADDDDIPF